MNRFISLLLACLFAFQATYVAAGDWCESLPESGQVQALHEDGHFGHHEHQHEPVPASQSGDSGHSGDAHADCQFCVSAASAALSPSQAPLPAPAQASAARPDASRFTSHFGVLPDRPPLAPSV